MNNLIKIETQEQGSRVSCGNYGFLAVVRGLLDMPSREIPSIKEIGGDYYFDINYTRDFMILLCTKHRIPTC